MPDAGLGIHVEKSLHVNRSEVASALGSGLATTGSKVCQRPRSLGPLCCLRKSLFFLQNPEKLVHGAIRAFAEKNIPF